MRLSEFDYFLPKERIAQEGLKERDQARLLVLEGGERRHAQIKDLPQLLRPGDVLILNDTRVILSKLIGRKDTGGKIDCLLLPPNGHAYGPAIKEAFVRGPHIKPGITLKFSSAREPQRVLRAKILEKVNGTRFKLEFDDPSLIETVAEAPLPPYIKQKLDDPDRYQTVYSQKEGSLAAPTAGLHFTRELMDCLAQQGVEFVCLTLHVGIGTFAPIRTEDLKQWKMHPEHYEVSEQAAERINAAVAARRRCFAVGTTTVRTLESATVDGRVQAGSGATELFIYPGYTFRFPYAGLLTNFHLPKSSLLLLASAFAGKERLLSAYQEAIKRQYRFFSFGDAMLIFPNP